MASDIRSKIGVGFLKKRPEAQTEADQHTFNADQFIGEAVLLFTTRVLAALATSGDTGARVFDIAKSEKIPVGDVLKVVDFLKTRDFAKVLEADEIGNDRLATTAVGRQFLQRSS